MEEKAMQSKNSGPSSVPKKYRKYYEALLDLQQEILGRTRELGREASQAEMEPGQDLVDQSTEEILRTTELALMSEEERKLQLIEEALDRIEQGAYGVCIDCGGKISPKRLELIPYAKLCVRCKEAREANDGLPPNPGHAATRDAMVE